VTDVRQREREREREMAAVSRKQEAEGLNNGQKQN